MELQLLLLALDAALYPTLLAAVVILLSQPRRKSLLTAYLAGGLTISIGLGLAIIAVLKGSGAVPSSSSGLSWVTDLAVGGLALLLAVALALPDTRPSRPTRTRSRRSRSPNASSRGARPRSSSSRRWRSTCRAPPTSWR